MNIPPDFSIIIPTHNRIPQLSECLRGVSALDCPREKMQVVVVNDGGTEIPKAQVMDWQRELDFAVLTQTHRGPSAARNLGARHARNLWLVFTDDDCVPERDWLKQFAQTLRL